MRKVTLVTLAVAVGLAGACGGGEPPKAATATPASATTATATAEPAVTTRAEDLKTQVSPAQARQKTMMDYGAAMNAHDAKKLAALYADGAIVKLAGMPDNVGRDAIAQGYQHEFDAFSDTKSQATRVWVKDDVAILEWAWAAKHTGDLGPIKATEKPVGAQGVDVLWFTADGTAIKEQHTYFDMGTILSQIGVSKQRARAIPTVSPGTMPQIILATGDAAEQKNADAANRMWAAFEPKGENDFVAGLGDDVQWDDLTFPDTSKGKEAGRRYFKQMTVAFPDLKATPANAWAVADYVIVEGAMTGTNKGPLFGVPAKNKAVNVHMIEILQYKDGKAIHGWSYANGAEMAQQLGR
jgi:steroid delta-isomerase-like uncharacterized protein